MKIGFVTLDRISQGIMGHLTDYQPDIEAAYHNQGEVSISLTVKMAPGKTGIDYEIGMNLVKDRIKVKSKGNIDERQIPLFSADGDTTLRKVK